MALHKTLNNLIARWWQLAGGLIFGAGIMQLMQRLVIGGNLFDFLIISSVIFFGVFCIIWASAMIGRPMEWGAFCATLVRIMWTLNLLGAGYLLYQRPQVLLLPVGSWVNSFLALSWVSWLITLINGSVPINPVSDIYINYPWLIWFIYILLIFWLFATTIWLLHPARRRYYALTYQNYPRVAFDTCPYCGLILQNDLCPEHDKRSATAKLTVGDKVYTLPFIEGDAIRTVGRQRDTSPAYITLSDKDVSHPERISSKHIAILYNFEEDAFFLKDTSSNGTYLNALKLTRNDWVPLDNEARIMLADQIEVLFECVEGKK